HLLDRRIEPREIEVCLRPPEHGGNGDGAVVEKQPRKREQPRLEQSGRGQAMKLLHPRVREHPAFAARPKPCSMQLEERGKQRWKRRSSGVAPLHAAAAREAGRALLQVPTQVEGELLQVVLEGSTEREPRARLARSARRGGHLPYDRFEHGTPLQVREL